MNNGCTGNGTCDIPNQICKCNAGWGGSTCEIALTTSTDCSPKCVNGVCDLASGMCNCNKGWGGASCDLADKTGGTTPDIPYLEWKGGKCVLGNSLLKRWCQYPSSRHSESIVGETDVAPFDYSPETGCSISKAYCTNCRQSDPKGMCIGYDAVKKECVVPPGQGIGEMLAGKTIFRYAKGEFQFVPDVPVVFPQDDVLMKEKFVIGKVGGVDLCLFQYDLEKVEELLGNEDVKRECRNRIISVGFNGEDIMGNHPSIIQKNQNGVAYIFLSPGRLTPDLYKIYFFLRNRDKIVNDILFTPSH
jgi:hypothetical protein